MVSSKMTDGDWYDIFYEAEQEGFPCWYEFMLAELVKEVEIDSKVLELGCGQSKGLRYLVEKGFVDQGNVFGVDQSKTAIEFSRRKLPSADLRQGDINQLDFEDSTFDYVLLMEVIEHLETPGNTLMEIHRC